MFSRTLRLSRFSPSPLVPLIATLIIAFGCGNSADGTESPASNGATPIPISTIAVNCDVDLGLGPEDAKILDFMDQEQVWRADWDGEALILTRRYSCGDECSEEEILRIEDALAACPQEVGVRVTLRDRGEPGWKPQSTDAREGSLTLQDWQVDKDGALLVSGRVDAGAQFVFYLDTRVD